MSKKALFDVYQYAAPIILTPVAYLLWNDTYGPAYHLTAIAFVVPIAFAYIVPVIGTNVCRVWRFNSPLMVGNFRIHHGFIFGSVTSVLVWVTVHHPVSGLLDVVVDAFVAGTVVAFWNVIYDIQAMRAGVIEVFTERSAEKAGPEAVVLDYAPIVFGLFAASYVGFLKIVELYTQMSPPSLILATAVTILGTLVSVAVPIGVYMMVSRARYGHFGLFPVGK